MWKKFNNQRGQRQSVMSPIQSPLHGNPYDGSAGLGINISPPMSPPGQNYIPPRPRRDDEVPKGLPRLPFEAAPPPPPPHTESTLRPASSLYSQHSPNPTNARNPRTSMATPSTTYTQEVSPPSSPELDTYARRSHTQYVHDDEVSPIDEMPDPSQLHVGEPNGRPGSSSKPPSNIPVLRREKRRNQVAAVAANLVTRKIVGDAPKGRKAADVRWDPYSGEQTNSEKGKPQSVKPGEFTLPGLTSVKNKNGPALGQKSNITTNSKTRPSFGDRVRNLRVNTAAAERPEWRGASGRQAVVSPVADDLNVLPLNVPRKSSRRVTSPQSGRSQSSTPVSVIRNQIGDETTLASAQPIDPAIGSVLSNSGQESPEGFIAPTSTTAGPTLAPAADINARNPLSDLSNTHQRKGSASSIERNFREALKDVNFHLGDPAEPYDQPPSRFSVTTYAPSEFQSTPRPSIDTSDRPPMPTPPQQYTTTQQPTPILNRKRPKVTESPKATARKAINPSSPVFISMSTKRASNIGKNLPVTPAEAQSHDLITSLQAQLDNLAHRRQNITRSIRQMTELMPTDSVVASDQVRRKREMEKMKVERLRIEEADVRREEHEVGLKLHRAWKRRDKDAVFEPTGLWVRRVTG